MRNLYLYFYLFFCISCIAQENKSFIDVGMNFPDSLKKHSFSLSMTGSANIEKCYKVSVDSILYRICVNSNNLISYIETSDSTFQTKEGIKTGMTLSAIRKYNKSDLYLETGWAYILPLPSGWCAAFDYKTESIKSESEMKIKWLFLRLRK